MKTIPPFRGIQYFKYLRYLEVQCALIEQLAINSNSTSNSELSVCQPASYLIGPVISCNVGNVENISMELSVIICEAIAHVKLSSDGAIEFKDTISSLLSPRVAIERLKLIALIAFFPPLPRVQTGARNETKFKNEE